jgi:apolipoprotein D and lipocalin family protein
MLTVTLNGEILENWSSESKLDLRRYSGTWNVLASIPTHFDKHWTYAKDTYTLNNNGKVDICTVYREENDPQEKSVRSKGFPLAKEGYFKWRVQYFWPFRVDYQIEELADDYSYVVVGHPKHKFLYIMSREEKMDEDFFDAIVDRCRRKGYDITKLKRMKK